MQRLFKLAMLAVVATGCGDGDDIDSDEEARRAYLGLDASIAKSLTLGFAGFNTATSANIAPQTDVGLAGGMLTITGQVDQGESLNKEMRLRVGMVDYSDGEVAINDDGDTIIVTYNTNPDPTLQPALTLSLKGIPTGTLDGSLIGTYVMTGDLEGEANLSLTFAGMLQDGGNGTVIRAPGTTSVTGTVTTPGDGVFTVDLKI